MPRNTESDNRINWIALMGGVGQGVYVPAGQMIFQAGHLPRLALVTAGIVRVFLHDARRRQLTIRYARAGDLVGLAPLLARSQAWNAEAVTDTAAQLLHEADLRAAATRDAEIAWAIAEYVAAGAADAFRSAAESAAQPTIGRIARHIHEMAQVTADGSLVVSVSHQRLADAAGVAREVATRELARLRAAGVITTGSRRIIVRDAVRLEGIASGMAATISL